MTEENTVPSVWAIRKRECDTCRKRRNREWRKRNPRKDQRAVTLKVYGLTEEDFDRILLTQGGGCAICGSKDSGRPGKSMHVDHDHKTKKVRGLLCHHCNTMLGHAKDNPVVLVAAAKYLKGNK